MKRFIYALVFVIVISIGFNLFIPSVNTVSDLSFISANDTFTQADEDYVVYFYQETCQICTEFSSILVDAHVSDNTPVYVVDMGVDENKVAWYDWETHHEIYDEIIGTVVDDQQVLNEDVDLEDYSTEDGWSIITEGDQVIAINNKAVNNTSPKDASELEISGTPTLIRITNGEVTGYGAGIEENTLILEEMK